MITFRAGTGCHFRPEYSVAKFCAGMEYLFLRGREKCSRLRGNPWPNPLGMNKAVPDNLKSLALEFPLFNMLWP
jgi:hypothetical protein